MQFKEGFATLSLLNPKHSCGAMKHFHSSLPPTSLSALLLFFLIITSINIFANTPPPDHLPPLKSGPWAYESNQFLYNNGICPDPGNLCPSFSSAQLVAINYWEGPQRCDVAIGRVDPWVNTYWAVGGYSVLPSAPYDYVIHESGNVIVTSHERSR